MVNKRAIATSILVVIALFFIYFVFVPVEWVDTHPSVLPQLAFLGSVQARESLSCGVFGVGASDWPVPVNGTSYQYWTYQYRLGCPPLWTVQQTSTDISTYTEST